MKPLLLLLLLSVGPLARGSDFPDSGDESPAVILVVGAAGEKGYGVIFTSWAKLWEAACRTAKAPLTTIGLDQLGQTNQTNQVERANQTNDVDLLKAALDQQPKEGERERWIVLLGHGTFDGKEAKFNLRGPDLSATNLATWLEPFQRPLAVINTASASGPFLAKLSRPGRVIITATRSGYEQNYARFGQYFSAAISDLKADLDKDGQVSLLEAFLMAAHQVAEFYTTEGRLATEHALIDDNGDGLGTPADWFRGIRAVKKPAQGASLDGLRAHQFNLIRSEAERLLSPALRSRRNELELAVMQLRESKESMPVDEYYNQLEKLLLDLAHLYESAEKKE